MQKFSRVAAVLLVVVAVVLAIVAFSLGHRAVTPTEASVTVSHAVSAPSTAIAHDGVPVVVAATVLAAGRPISPESLRVASMPQRPSNGYADVVAVTGSIPVMDIPAGTPLTADVFAQGMSMALRPGERALAIPVDEQAGAGNRVLPGDYVDVFLSLKASRVSTSGQAITDRTQTRLLLSRLRVLAYGSQDLPMQPQSGTVRDASDRDTTKPHANTNARQASSGTDSESRAAPRTAVLAVPVGDTDRLLLGMQDGKLSLALRHPGDMGEPDDALFPRPRTVLSPRTDLTASQRQLLELPDNRAYAGIDGLGLAGESGTLPGAYGKSHHAAISNAVEIIRGTSDDRSRPSRINSP
jgi:pilus assembly protein CpaB